jgi:membrane associated rhomboid family serine protease
MPGDTIVRLLLWAVALNAGLLILLLWRRGIQGRGGYVALLGANLVLSVALLVANRHDHPLAFVAIGAFVFLVVVPMLLRVVTAWAVRGGRWDLALWLTDLRQLLQPGAGVGREKELLSFLRQVQAGETGDILAQLKQQAEQTEDDELRAVLHEQVLTLLVLERRWEEAEQHAREAVTPAMVAARPRLGAALIRVYGEQGDLEALVRTMSLVEGGSGAQDPEAAEVLEHCRIMVLAFTGHARELRGLLGQRRLPAAEHKVYTFWLGVAWQQAGEPDRAREAFDRAEALLDDDDQRAREAIAARRARLTQDPGPVRLPDPDQTARLVGAIRERAERQLAQPRMRPSVVRQTPVTLAMVIINLVIYAVVEWFGPDAELNRRLVLAGASLSGAVDAGEYWRLATAMFLHAGWFHLTLNTFMLWFLGRFAEQLLGSVRFFIVYFTAGVVGNTASHLFREYPVSVGASSSIFGLLGAALMVLLLSRGRLPESWRRSVVFVLLLVIGLSFLPGLVDVKQIDNYAHLGGLAGGVVVGFVLLRFAGRPLLGWLGPLLGLACVASLLYAGYGLLTSDLEQLPWSQSERAGVRVRHPVTWFAVPGERPGQITLYHLLAQDRVTFDRGQPSAESAEVWLRGRLQHWRAQLEQGGPGGQRFSVSAVRRKRLPAAWRAVRLDVVEPDGRRAVVVEAYGGAQSTRSSPSTEVAWRARLDTGPKRLDRLLGVFSRMLGQVRSVR